MTAQHLPPPIMIHLDSTARMNEELTTAEALMRSHALRRRDCGILVTRHTDTMFTVALSTDVPFGTTKELSLS